MKNSISVLVVLMVSMATTAFANNEANPMTSEMRTHNTFYGLVVASDVNIILTQGDAQSVRVEAAQTDLPYINTKVIKGSLVVSVRNNHKLTAPAIIYITMHDINLIEVIGNGKVRCNEMINADALNLKVKGNGSINIDVRAVSVGMNMTGCGNITVSGNAANSFIKIYGQGAVITTNFSAFNMVEWIDDTPIDCTAMKS